DLVRRADAQLDEALVRLVRDVRGYQFEHDRKAHRFGGGGRLVGGLDQRLAGKRDARAAEQLSRVGGAQYAAARERGAGRFGQGGDRRVVALVAGAPLKIALPRAERAHALTERPEEGDARGDEIAIALRVGDD